MLNILCIFCKIVSCNLTLNCCSWCVHLYFRLFQLHFPKSRFSSSLPFVPENLGELIFFLLMQIIVNLIQDVHYVLGLKNLHLHWLRRRNLQLNFRANGVHKSGRWKLSKRQSAAIHTILSKTQVNLMVVSWFTFDQFFYSTLCISWTLFFSLLILIYLQPP